MQISEESWRKYQEYREKKQSFLDEKERITSIYKKSIEDMERQLNIEKNQMPQNVQKIKSMQQNITNTRLKLDQYIQDIDRDIANIGTEVSGSLGESAGAVRAEKQAIPSSTQQRSKDALKSAYKGTQDLARGELDRQGFSPSFYRNIAAAFTGRAPGNTMNDAQATAQAQAKNQQNESSNRQMEAQASQQIADRNEYTEAGKVASMKNDAQNRQNIANKEGFAGAAAALSRQTNAPDVSTERSRQDQQRNIANNRRQEADVAQQGATQSQGLAMQYGHKADEYDKDYDDSDRLNNAQESLYNAQADYFKSLANQNQNQNQNKDTENTNTENTNTESTEPVTEPENTEPVTEPENTEPVTEPEGANNPRPEDTVVKETDITKPDHDPSKTGELYDSDFKDAAAEKSEQTRQDQIDTTGLDNLIAQKVEEYKGFGESSTSPLDNKERCISNIKQDKLFTEYLKALGNDTDADKYVREKVGTLWSDYRAKNIELCKAYEKQLSDCRMKWIKHDFDNYGKPSQEDYAWLTQRAGDYDFGSDNTEDESVLKGYADFIRNYVYNYKPEAQALSPDNDPNVTHIGPMAQDIEKVNPACINKDENGIESVDTGRVAMMNAGAIGDIARVLEDIQTRLARLEAQNGRY